VDRADDLEAVGAAVSRRTRVGLALNDDFKEQRNPPRRRPSES